MGRRLARGRNTLTTTLLGCLAFLLCTSLCVIVVVDVIPGPRDDLLLIHDSSFKKVESDNSRSKDEHRYNRSVFS